FIPSTDTEENTKAIPILSNNEYNETIRSDDETKIVNESTQPNNLKNEMEEKPKDKKKKPKKKKSKKKKIVIWLASLASVFLIASLVALFVLPSLLQPDDVELPDLEGELLEDAIDILTELELEYEEDEMYSEEFEEGHIVMTDPEADSSVKVGTTITL